MGRLGLHTDRRTEEKGGSLETEKVTMETGDHTGEDLKEGSYGLGDPSIKAQYRLLSE